MVLKFQRSWICDNRNIMRIQFTYTMWGGILFTKLILSELHNIMYLHFYNFILIFLFFSFIYSYFYSTDVASGSTVDWVFNELGVKIGYTIEFRDKGRYGFVLPPVQILPNCQELMAGMLALVDKSKELGYI